MTFFIVAAIVAMFAAFMAALAYGEYTTDTL
ncbi:MAG: hypothetical protein K0R85_799 [Devosia sp.]|jgi:hypothetical protein|nr:hypothetical protein [Devosia sp.]